MTRRVMHSTAKPLKFSETPLIEHLRSVRDSTRTVCGMEIADLTGRQSVADLPVPARVCLTCSSIRSHYGEGT